MSEDLEKRAPVQGYSAGIPWSMHLRAYDAYCKRYRPQPALIEGGCRGGFGTEELDMFIPGWREELSEIAALREKLAAEERSEAAWEEIRKANATLNNDNGALRVRAEAAEARATAAEAREAGLRTALERIERWFGEFPETGEFWPDPESRSGLSDRPISYGAAYGSNGERDYMRAIARAALTKEPGE